MLNAQITQECGGGILTMERVTMYECSSESPDDEPDSVRFSLVIGSDTYCNIYDGSTIGEELGSDIESILQNLSKIAAAVVLRTSRAAVTWALPSVKGKATSFSVSLPKI
jgi:hypothetical protein